MEKNIDKEYVPDEKIVFTNLKIISNIKEYDKLIIDENKHIDIDSPTYLQFARRWWSGRNRLNTLNYLKNCVYRDAFIIIDNTLKNEIKNKINMNYFEQSNHNILQKFLLDLKNSIRGLQNLKITYNNDVSFKSNLDVIIEEIEFRIEKIKETLKISIEPIPLRNGKIREIP